MKSIHARLFKIKDLQLLKKLLVLLLAAVCYLTTWSATQANQLLPRHQQCDVTVGELVLNTGRRC